MARVNVEQKALTDPRFYMLGDLAGAPPEYAHEVGLARAIRLWNESIERETDVLRGEIAQAIMRHSQGAEWFVDADLAEWVDDDCTLIRIKGANGRTDYKAKLRSAQVAGGKKRAAGAERDPKTGAFTSCHQVAGQVAGQVKPAPPSAPAPAPALTPDPEYTPPSLASLAPPQGGTRAPDLARFEELWKLYPHYEGRSRKAEARKRWTRLRLERKADQVENHLEAWMATNDWQRPDRVPGMQVWITRHLDLERPPPQRSEADGGDDLQAWAEGR